MKWLCLVCSLFIVGYSNASATVERQKDSLTRTICNINGRVTSLKGKPLSGVIIEVVDGESTVTDAEGRYHLQAYQWDVLCCHLKVRQYYVIKTTSPTQQLGIREAKIDPEIDPKDLSYTMRYSYDNQTLSKEAFLEHFRHHEVYKYRIRTYFSPTETPPYNKIRRALFEVFAVSKTYWKKELMTFLSDESIVEFESTE